jgi:SAM-dependent methyltransferase
MRTAIPEPRREILAALARGNLFQPATVLWRVYELEAILRHAPPLGNRVLDVGCGDGTLTRTVAALMGPASPLQWIGIEPDAADAAAARASGTYEEVHCVEGRATTLPSASFDGAFSNSVLEHIPDLPPVLAEVGRILRPGGRFVFTVPSEHFRAALGRSSLAAWLARRRGETPADLVDRRLRHVRYPSPEDWAALLARAGLRVEAAHRYFPLEAVRAWESVSSWTGGIAFELFGRKSETRDVQRRLRLPSVDRLVPPPAAGSAIRAIIGRHLTYPTDSDESGGLLVVAVKTG